MLVRLVEVLVKESPFAVKEKKGVVTDEGCPGGPERRKSLKSKNELGAAVTVKSKLPAGLEPIWPIPKNPSASPLV